MSSLPASGPGPAVRALARWSRPAFIAALGFATVMAWLPHPPRLPGEPSDKIQHIAAFLVLGLLSVAAFPKLRFRLLFLGLAAYGALIELVQTIPALNRDGDWLDWLADCAAALVALAVAKLVLELWRRRRLAVPNRDG